MSVIRHYPLATDFLTDAAPFLEQQELANNQILGLAAYYKTDASKAEQACMLQIWEQDKLQLCALLRNHKSILSGPAWNVQSLRMLKEEYTRRQVYPVGVTAEYSLAKAFAEQYGAKPDPERTLILHELKAVRIQKNAAGQLEPVKPSELETLGEWFMHFQKEVRNFPLRTMPELREDLERWMKAGMLFKWMDKGEIKSMAAIVRRSKNIAFVGLVYTPPAFRGAGYAGSCVQNLSKAMLDSGFSSCGLYTDKANPVSNHIYTKMGYVPSLEFSDISFEK
jgi:predicted GNAT family acetyltransferase